MRKILFSMDSGYIGSEEEEIVEISDDLTEDDIDELCQEWFWEKFGGSFSWEEVK